MCLRTHTNPDLSYDMSMHVFRLIIDQLVCSPFGKPTIRLVGLGEPLLNPHIASMVRHAKRRGLFVELVSNFTLANPKILEELVEAQLDVLGVSLDAASPRVFEKIRVGAKFEDVIGNVKQFLKTRERMNSAKPTIYFLSTINEDNVEEIPAIAELAKSIGVDQVVFSNQTESRKRTYEHLRLKRNVSESSPCEENKSEKTKSSSCGISRCYVTYDGKVLPCNILMMLIPRQAYSEFVFGDITQNSLRSIWFSKRYKQFRVLNAKGYHFHFCNGCPRISADPCEDFIISSR